MTISYGLVQVVCDGIGCDQKKLLALTNIIGTYGLTEYDDSDESIEALLTGETTWTVNEKGIYGHRYFCEACSDKRADRPTS